MERALEPFKLPGMALKNHFVRSATNDYICTDDGRQTERQRQMYRDLAANDIGLIITGHLYVIKTGKASLSQSAIYDDSFIPDLENIVEICHEGGSKVIAQLAHGGGISKPAESLRVGPSDYPIEKDRPCRALRLEEIEEIRESFIKAAMRAKKAGMDGVQIHMAHNYLLCQFMTPEYNHRDDQYGGSRENRIRLAVEIIEGIKKECGEDFPIFAKIDCNVKTDNELYYEDLKAALHRLEELGLQAVEISGIDYQFMKKEQHHYYLDIAAELQKELSMPLILVGGIRSPEDVKAVLDKGIQLISFGRPLISEPDLIPKLRAGQSARCISCNKCFSLALEDGRRCVFHEKV